MNAPTTPPSTPARDDDGLDAATPSASPRRSHGGRSSYDVAAHRGETHPAGNYLRGVVMGSADLVPGVSGGTMALITGIYERLVASVRGFTGLPYRLVRGDAAAVRRDVEWLLLLPVLLGMGTAIVLGAGIIPPLLEDHPERMNALFMGMIVASLPIPWRMVERHTRREYLLVVAGAVIAFVLAGLPSGDVADPALLVVFAAAAIAICAMVLPGVSGSYLLLVLGMYEVTLDAVHDREMAYVAVFALGALTGLTVFSRVLGYLLANWHAATMATLVGLMIGSLRALWPWQVEDERTLLAPDGGAGELVQVAAFFVVGLVVVSLLARLADRRGDGQAR